MSTESQAIVPEARTIIEEIGARGGHARLLGGIAIALRCPAVSTHAVLRRQYGDIDIVVGARQGKILEAVLAEHGFVGAKSFNAMHGRSRMLFERADGVHVDLFVNTFSMCHELALGNRLSFDEHTISLADLALTKLQIAQLNPKDASDLVALLLSHELTEDEAGINTRYLGELLGNDWGWWRTVSENVRRLEDRLPSMSLPERERELVGSRIARLRELLDSAPRSLRWRMRARVGDRVSWREEPEEIERR